MKVVRIENGRVYEIIPPEAQPVSYWYGEAFAAQCVEAPDEVEQNWTYDPETGTFSEPVPEVKPDPEPEPDPSNESVYDELAAAYREGVDQA